ncbi:hypothetical protein E6Q11_01080 [Candidatus Dojkabacteria bacterium]|uniref:Uncharacterized protein n=1 Tax=Candidatus Dojkabacteria bacterium TaxID=2099670 RepID=A0A5C7J9W0_9BACT|nr:MAG: hypothetical protein E6Q11_01080 [Candidatus Dojkabacteria bacterium]
MDDQRAEYCERIARIYKQNAREGETFEDFCDRLSNNETLLNLFLESTYCSSLEHVRFCYYSYFDPKKYKAKPENYK